MKLTRRAGLIGSIGPIYSIGSRGSKGHTDSISSTAGPTHVSRLDNGLEILVREVPGSAVVTTAIVFRAGTRDETAGLGGAAHFLEHMMFKGSAHYGPGEVDRRTQALGGSNNAFTAHDVTAYHFSFAADRWTEGLAIEADRMRGLTLDPEEVESERQVIVEEIAMYDDEPWDALELAVVADFYGDHPYGKPVLGTREDLARTGPAELRSFQEHHYRPNRAALVIAGGVDADEAIARAREVFGDVPGTASERAPFAAPVRARGPRRLERRHGEVARSLWALAAPAASEPEHAALRVLASHLASGRASGLHRMLVEERGLCLSVSADAHETEAPSVFTLGFELLPEVEPAAVEELARVELERLRREVLDSAAIERARNILLADWVFGHDKVHQQALALGVTAALFDIGHLDRQLQRIAKVSAEDVRAAAAQYLDPEVCSTVGWSLAETE